MSIRTRIIAIQLVVACAVLMMAGTVYFAIDRSHYHLERLQYTHAQLEAITRLAVHANRYSENIAELLLLGSEQLDDFYSARRELERSFFELSGLIDKEIEFIDSIEERKQEEAEAHRLERMRLIYTDLNSLVERLFLLREEGRHDEAVALFRKQIEERLDAEFEQLVAEAVADERHEAGEVDRAAAQLARGLTLLVAAVLLIAIGLSIGAGIALDRTLSRPIKQLIEGASVIGRGDLGYRIRYAGRDELGTLSRQFNDMAAQLQSRREDLLKAQAGLEEQVQQRTRQLEAVNRRLEDLDRLRVLFLAEISHELRTPLTVLRGEAEVALRGGAKPAEDYRETLERIVQQVASMGRLVDDLLFLARSEADQIRFDMQIFSLKELVADAVREGVVLGRQRNVAVNSAVPEAPLLVSGDPQRLKQALVIVIENAVKYSDNGGSVGVALSRLDGCAETTVTDNGPGIPPEDLPYVFDRFYRGRSSGARIAGAGLGLAIAKWIVEKHGGTISLESRPGKTRVKIRISAGSVA